MHPDYERSEAAGSVAPARARPGGDDRGGGGGDRDRRWTAVPAGEILSASASYSGSTRISVTDDGAAIDKAGRPARWREAVERLNRELIVNVSQTWCRLVARRRGRPGRGDDRAADRRSLTPASTRSCSNWPTD